MEPLRQVSLDLGFHLEPSAYSRRQVRLDKLILARVASGIEVTEGNLMLCSRLMAGSSVSPEDKGGSAGHITAW